MCYADEQSNTYYSSGSSDGDDRCDSYQCAHAGWYCYDGGFDNYGCSQGIDEAGPCCGSGAPSVPAFGGGCFGGGPVFFGGTTPARPCDRLRASSFFRIFSSMSSGCLSQHLVSSWPSLPQ